MNAIGVLGKIEILMLSDGNLQIQGRFPADRDLLRNIFNRAAAQLDWELLKAEKQQQVQAAPPGLDLSSLPGVKD